jgi:hypothetical protein
VDAGLWEEVELPSILAVGIGVPVAVEVRVLE